MRCWILLSLLFCLGNAFSQQKISTFSIPDSLLKEFSLSDDVRETSGLIFWENLLWTHNDDNDPSIYGINPSSGKTEKTVYFKQLKVKDWEEIQHDDNYFYIGDIGNNYKGNRTDLRIFKKSKHLEKTDTIRFYYPEQTDLLPQKSNETNFDCEAFLVTDTMIYLFTKEWKSQATTLYKLPNKQGIHTAVKISSFNVNGLITGAAFSPDTKRIVLTGYSKTLNPFLYLLTGFQQDDFLNGEKKRLKINKRFLQIESVAFISSSTIAVTNEQFNRSLIKSPQQLIIIDLSSFID